MSHIQVILKKNPSSKALIKNFVKGKVYKAELSKCEVRYLFYKYLHYHYTYYLGEGLFFSNFETYNRINRIDSVLDGEDSN